MQRYGLFPDMTVYVTVLTALAKRQDELAAERIRTLLNDLNSMHNQRLIESRVHGHCYAVVICTLASQGKMPQADQLLREQCERFQTSKIRDLLPPVECFNNVITGWARSNIVDAPHMAEATLLELESLAEFFDGTFFRPDVTVFNSVLRAWSRSDDPITSRQCEAILTRMQDLYLKGWTESQPDKTSFHITLTCLANSYDKTAPQRAGSILRRMVHLYKSDSLHVKPNCFIYNTVIKAWAKSTSPGAAERAHALFEELKQKWLTEHDEDLKPNGMTYATVISSWGRTMTPNGASKAQAIFGEIVTRYKSGDVDMKPTKVVYCALMDAWAKAGEPEKSELMLRAIQSGESAVQKPDIVCYTTVINAWAQPGLANGPERAQAVFNDLKQRFEAGDNSLMPNTMTFGALIKQWQTLVVGWEAWLVILLMV